MIHQFPNLFCTWWARESLTNQVSPQHWGRWGSSGGFPSLEGLPPIAYASLGLGLLGLISPPDGELWTQRIFKHKCVIHLPRAWRASRGKGRAFLPFLRLYCKITAVQKVSFSSIHVTCDVTRSEALSRLVSGWWEVRESEDSGQRH